MLTYVKNILKQKVMTSNMTTFQSFWCITKNNDKHKTYSNCKCMMVTTILYMVSIKSSRLREPYISYMIYIKSSRLSEPGSCVPIKWLSLVNSWNLWNYTLTDIFNHFNCSISITISLNIASKGQLTASLLLHWFQSVTSLHQKQWWASMMHKHAPVDISGYTL